MKPGEVLSQALAEQVREWIDHDPDPSTVQQLTDQLAAAKAGDQVALRDLAEAFAGPLEFGTAGLRGRMGGGPGRMNRAVVIRAAAGLITYLRRYLAMAGALDEASPPKVVIGYDGRHGSAEFAEDTAAVVVAAGGRALLMETHCPTPLLAYAVRYLTADAGVMVTASHNPAQDNGYKVYLGGRLVEPEGNGVQIVPPADVDIAAAIAAAPPADQVPRARGWEIIGPDLATEYLREAVAGLPTVTGAKDLRIVHTAMHGVGARLALPALEQAGFTDVHAVPEQRDPNPDFPTVAFPNPEEPGAIDLAIGLAGRVGADLVLAHDPDADRCAAAVYDPRAPRGGGWRMLTGDEVGSLLAEEAAKLWEGQAEAPDGVRPTLASSIVSSRLLWRIARAHLLAYAKTLTGFKWIARTPGLVFGYEEAIGYCTRPDMVRDKDGITAGLALARLAARAKAKDQSLIDLLDDLARQHGLHLTSQVAARLGDPRALTEVMAALRRKPPTHLGGVAVTKVTDLEHGTDGLPPTDGLAFALKDLSRVVIRPSGTEPKVKCYLEVILPVGPTASFEDITALRRQGAAHLEAIGTSVRQLLER
ncbi:MAG: phospho-sugar mutase [Bifidobacteriaceae bacterium]|jgi:phosphomannomutase|nr:phospho-sugar mutase [Bifidobacteriaceae bacterium]